MNNINKISKRSVLKSTSAAIIPMGSKSIDLSGNKAQRDNDTQYSEIVIKYKNTPEAPKIHSDNFAEVLINPNKRTIRPQKFNGEQVPKAASQNVKNKLLSKSHVVRCGGYRSPPFKQNQNSKSEWIPINGTTKVKAEEKVPIPQIKVIKSENNKTLVKVKNNTISVEPMRTAKIQLEKYKIKFKIFGKKLKSQILELVGIEL